MKPITVITTSRRPNYYSKFVYETERKIGKYIEQYIVFVNDSTLKQQYNLLKIEFDKVNVVFAPDNYLFKKGFDSAYNLLLSQVKTKFAWMLFDTDEVILNNNSEFERIIESDYNYIGIQTHMQRGDSTEYKYQLYDPKLVRWVGAVHENQIFNGEIKSIDIDSNAMSVKHKNAIDIDNESIKKTEDGFIIIEKHPEGSDSFNRNLLYEALTYRIVHENLYHKYRGWFVRHYEINKEVVDWYYQKALEKWG